MLGAMLVSPPAAIWATERLTPSDFYRVAHGQIFEGMQHLVAHKVAVDFQTVYDYFRTRGQVEDVGGLSYITGLTDGVPRATNIEYYAGILQNDRLRRDILGVSDRIVAEVVEGHLRAPALIDKADEWLMSLPRHDREDDFVLARDRGVALLKDFEMRVAREGSLAGLSTGLTTLDGFTSGLQPGDLTILAARPSVGKTALAGHLCLTAAQDWKTQNIQQTAGFFSLEMSREQVEYRHVAGLSGLMLFRILNARQLSDFEQRRIALAINDYAQLPIAIDASGRITVEVIRSKARRLQVQNGLGLLVLDYIQLITGSGVAKNERGNRNIELAHASRQLKLLAKELHIPVVVLSQLSRAPEGRDDKRPTMSDLRDSGALEQDADNILLLHQPPASINDHGGAVMEIIIAKQRNGPTGITSVYFARETMQFRDVTPEDRAELELNAPAEKKTQPVRRPNKAPRPPSFDLPMDDE